MPIYYESRLAKLELKPEEKPTLDEEFEEVTEGEELERKEKLKTKWAALAKARRGERRPDEYLHHAIQQLVSKAVDPGEVVDIFTVAGLNRPDISILSDEFLAEVRGLTHRNLTVEVLRKLLNEEIRTRGRRHLVQARPFAEMLERSIRAYQNRAVETAQVIEELIALAKEMREAVRRGEQLDLNEDEAAFYEALELNDSAVAVLGDVVAPDVEVVAEVEEAPGHEHHATCGRGRERRKEAQFVFFLRSACNKKPPRPEPSSRSEEGSGTAEAEVSMVRSTPVKCP